ncbi:MAG: QcrA and Rieske domain-containing protein [Candidatus Deferrimicrobiaceae bacterium]
METLDRSRRSVLGAIAAAVASLASLVFLGRFLSPRLPGKSAPLSVPKAEIPRNGALVYRERRVAVIREEKGYYAIGLACTHLGCTVAVTPDRLVCPCHGSVFDRRGNVLKGPADRPLPKYAVEDKGEHLLVYM